MTPLGMPVDPDVKLNVAGESGPRMTPTGVDERDWNGSKMSAPEGDDPLTPASDTEIAGTSSRRERFSLIYSETVGASVPADEMMSSARGLETER